MRRREFITLLGGTATAWPLMARAQQAERVQRIGVLSGSAANDPYNNVRIAAIVQALQQLGWTIGHNVRIDTRCPGHAATAVGPLLQATRTVPVVFPTVVDPVGAGFVDSLARPGRQRHRFHSVRIQPEREIAGAAQGDRAEPDASSGPSECRQTGCRRRALIQNGSRSI